MAAVNEPSFFRIPPKLSGDPELSAFFQEQAMFLFQLWKRTGGGTDEIIINNDQITNNTTNISIAEQGWPDSMYSGLDFQGAFTESVQSSDYTTTGNEIIKLSADVGVTLNATPSDNERVYVKSTGKGFNVKSSKKIDGHSDTRFNRAYSGYWFSYSLELDTWSIL